MNLLKQKRLAAVQLAVKMENTSEEVAGALTEGDKIQAATELAFLFNDNIEFIIWALKYAGDMPSAKRDTKPTQPSPGPLS